jgi:hypothetical protein
MYVFTWYGKPSLHNVAEFKKPFRYVKTIAVSVFSGKESFRQRAGCAALLCVH